MVTPFWHHFSYFKLLCLAKDHWRGFITRNAHMDHIKFNPIENGVYILVEVSFWNGGILLWTDFWFKILLKFKASMPLLVNFIFRNGRFFVSIESSTLTALNSLFEEMSKIIPWSRCSGDSTSVKCKVSVDSYNTSRSESYSVLSPFLSKLRYAYRWNRENMFYLLVYFKIESEIAVKS